MAWLRMALALVRNLFRERGEIAIENLARHQLAVLSEKGVTAEFEQMRSHLLGLIVTVMVELAISASNRPA